MFTVFGFYKFQKINDLKKNQKILSNLLTNKNINGSIIISKEGLNGSISGMNKDIKTTIIRLKKILNIKEFDSVNNSVSKFKPFHKPKVKIKREVVPMDLKMSNRITKKNTHIDPTKWNKLIKKKETLLLDARKPFEHKVGSFKKSVNPNISNFRDFPKYLKKLKKDQPIRDKMNLKVLQDKFNSNLNDQEKFYECLDKFFNNLSSKNPNQDERRLWKRIVKTNPRLS